MNPKTLDHVALWVSDPDGIARRLSPLGLRVIERTDKFTLVGGDARHGKLTLFAADPPREAGALEHVGLRVRGELAGRELDVGDGLHLILLERDGEIDLDHVALRVPDPAASARRWREYGFAAAAPGGEGHPRVEVGGAYLELRPGAATTSDQPLLNHLGVLVDSVEDHRSGAEARGIEVENVVDAPNTLALFVRGPDGVRLEYIEHKPEFSLV